MALIRRPTPRLIVWGALLVAVAVITGLAGMRWWLIILIMVVAWAVVTIADRALSRTPTAPKASSAEEEEQPARPEPVAAEEAQPEAPPPPTRRRVVPTPARSRAAAAPPPEHVRWNVWSLERIARDSSTEGLEYLVVSLRDFADADGRLPADFDPLVRESFGDLLVG